MNGVEDASSPLSPCSDNSDAVNTSSARVYFGPVQSPEKKFAPLLSPCKPSTHTTDVLPALLRRSPRLSSPPAPQSEDDDGEETEQEEEEENSSASPGKCSGGLWHDTPLRKILRQDEPSSAIASRIMRAHDNPSPPPKALRPPSATPRRMSKLVNEFVFPSLDSSEESSDAAVEAMLPTTSGKSTSPSPPRDLLLDFPFAASSPARDHSGSPTPRRSSRRRTSATPQPEVEGDLISFDRSILVVTDTEGPVIHSPSPQLAVKPMQTVDDLLLSSPPSITIQDESNTSESVAPSPNVIVPPTEELLGTAPSTPPRRRSPRLSALSRSPTPEPPKTEETPKRRSPRPSDASGHSPRSRKRLRNGTEKTADDNLLLSPSKVDWATDSDITDNESDAQSSPRRRKRAKNSFDNRADERNLQFTESLSPESARILMTLTKPEANLRTSPILEINMESPANTTIDTAFVSTLTSNSTTTVSGEAPSETPKRPPSSVQRPPPGTFNLISSGSPIKLTLTPALDDPNRTPARRVKINADNNPHDVEVAPGVVYTPVSRPPVGDPRRTPARRIPISDIQSTGFDGRSKSPGPSRQSPAKISVPNEKTDNKVEDVSSMISSPRPTAFLKSSTLGIRPAAAGTDTLQSNHLVRPSVAETSSTKPALPSRLHSVKKVPSVPQPGSRIPRIGPAPKPGSASQKFSKLPMPSSKNLNTPNAPPSRLPSPIKPTAKPFRLAQSSSESEDSSSNSSSQQNGPFGVPPRSTTVTANLKPKQPAKRVTPPRPIKARQVIPGMFGGPAKRPVLKKPDEAQSKLTSPVKAVDVAPYGPMKVREVVKGTLKNFQLRAASSKIIELYTEARGKELAEVTAASASGTSAASNSESRPATSQGPPINAFTFSCPVPQSDVDRMEVDDQVSETGVAPTVLSPEPNDIEMSVHSTAATVTNPVLKSSGSRRSSRTRKPVLTDVFGTVTTISSTPRRKPDKGPPKAPAPGNIVFFTNGTALKNLTNNNTTRNQRYHAELETLIIRKAGNRPESPTMKLRTVAEKQKEEQIRLRAERARRRQIGDFVSVDGESSMEVDVDSLVPPLNKHRRGPGDEEDYVTPMRSDNAGKRVKWDRGLETAVFLDDIELQPGRRKIAEKAAPNKGCLIFDPDRAPIDDLGNAVNANAPLDLAPEKVVVTKYLYDNDVLVEEIEPPRTTRSRSKRKS